MTYDPLSPRDARRQLVALGWPRHEARVLIRMARRLGLDLRNFVADEVSAFGGLGGRRR